ncbi:MULTISPECIES: LysR family transcriptional regulator [Sphingobium]|jgi:LysR family nod box-dependent transcriptional activator|uniref:LysR family transcriptional regulator n=3 Tax=Sphingobium fuliginis (strain ATCC 27551) TaxID=336203 RepID=A0A292ZBL9_SPHSA|nr:MULTISPECIES: LysR family transcriptional regulator [Sphingobium]OAP29924.1 hypothetical protein A8O16_21085 [Sphingobium sp. 20006FA]KXU30243.1 hypothetical protein AXW74_18715 [Sphingobium sp. AM]KYC30333.1 hypothetical protein A0J57_21110 [Sphingobium sp. 22B]QDC37866.1 LysR family transcriptional regulator [Sphingobium fuliginis ATCC 27551]QOT70432.1 LysR family transcriptional regulator [Sphingobium fuliginis]
MELTQFDINLLRALDVLLQEKSVTRAARRLFVTQPAASGSLQRLREIFQDPLLIRVGRGMELTPQGQALVDPVHEAILVIERLLQVGPSFHPRTSQRTFRFAMSDYCTHTILPGLMQRISIEAPNVRIAVAERFTKDFDPLQLGDLDMQITLDDQRVFADDDQFQAMNRMPLIEDRFVCVVSADHPVSSPLTLAEYTRFPHASSNHDIPTVPDVAHRLAGVATHDRVMIGSFTSQLFQLPGTDMIAIAPYELAAMLAPMLHLRIMEPPFAVDPITEAAFWHARNNSDPGHVWLRGLLQEISADIRSRREARQRETPGAAASGGNRGRLKRL